MTDFLPNCDWLCGGGPCSGACMWQGGVPAGMDGQGRRQRGRGCIVGRRSPGMEQYRSALQHHATLDIDLRNPEAAQAVADMVRDWFNGRGTILTRTGEAPKRAIPFRTEHPFQKILVKFVKPEGSKDKPPGSRCWRTDSNSSLRHPP